MAASSDFDHYSCITNMIVKSFCLCICIQMVYKSASCCIFGLMSIW